MRHFIIDITYKVPAESLGEIVSKHREFLQTGYDKGWLLMSGPKNPRTGGIIIARCSTFDEIRDFFSNDPYKIHGLADYSFTEFDPVKKQEWMSDWVSS